MFDLLINTYSLCMTMILMRNKQHKTLTANCWIKMVKQFRALCCLHLAVNISFNNIKDGTVLRSPYIGLRPFPVVKYSFSIKHNAL